MRKHTKAKPLLLGNDQDPGKIQFWLIFSSLSLSVPPSEQLQVDIQQISMLRLSSAAFSHTVVSRATRKNGEVSQDTFDILRGVTRHLAMSVVFTMISSSWLVRWKQHGLPKIMSDPVTWKGPLQHELVLMPGKSLVPEPWQTGGPLPSAWEKASLQFHMHKIKSVSSGQCCHCCLSQSWFKRAFFPLFFQGPAQKCSHPNHHHARLQQRSKEQ